MIDPGLKLPERALTTSRGGWGIRFHLINQSLPADLSRCLIPAFVSSFVPSNSTSWLAVPAPLRRVWGENRRPLLQVRMLHWALSLIKKAGLSELPFTDVFREFEPQGLYLTAPRFTGIIDPT